MNFEFENDQKIYEFLNNYFRIFIFCELCFKTQMRRLRLTYFQYKKDPFVDSTPNKLLLDLLVCAKDNVPISKDYPVEPEDEFDKQNIDNKVAYFVTLATVNLKSINSWKLNLNFQET